MGVEMVQNKEVVAEPLAFFSREDVIAVIPAFNEDRFIGSVVLKTLQYAANVIVVDDGCQDQTSLVAEQAGALVIRHSCNQGKTAAMQTGLRKARDFFPSVVVMLDADGQHHPEDIPTLIQPILAGEAHIVVGSRFLKEGNKIPRWRIFGQHSLTHATNLLSGVKLTDSQSGFRAFTPDVLDQLNFRREGFSFESEIQFLAKENKLKIKEVPIGVTYAEKSKRNPVKHGMQVLNSILYLVGQFRPLLFFGVTGALILLVGVGMGVYVVEIYSRSKQLATGYAMVSVLLSIIGMLLLSNGITLHTIRALLMEYFSRQSRP